MIIKNIELVQTTALYIPQILQRATTLPTHGHLVKTVDNLVALKIDDDYIHQLYPLLQGKAINKPNYFGEQGVGAHISVFYPAENVQVDAKLLGQEYSFKIKDLLKAKIINKNYFVLTIESPGLLLLRQQYGLVEKLLFKNYWIDFHITIGVS